MTIYQILKQQHKEVAKIFKQIEKCDTSEIPTLTALFRTLKLELGSHAKAEEKVLYEKLKNRAKDEEDKDLSQEGKQEHHVAALLLNELSIVAIGSEDWFGKITVLKELVEHHVEEEENEIFDASRKIFSRSEANVLAEDYLKLQEEFKKDIDKSLREDIKIFHQPKIASHFSNSDSTL